VFHCFRVNSGITLRLSSFNTEDTEACVPLAATRQCCVR
jgi:hypothetical protein